MTDHAAEAHALIRQSDPALAQVHATLALAEEQRTANLIAFYDLAPFGTDTEALRADIRTRLGLTPTTPNREQP